MFVDPIQSPPEGRRIVLEVSWWHVVQSVPDTFNPLGNRLATIHAWLAGAKSERIGHP